METSPAPRTRNFLIILILGSLATVSPFSIDMYLPAFSQMAESLHTTPGSVALSLSSYFVGLSIGQVFYGPLLDRFGRKRPLYVGLFIFVLASFACMKSSSIEALIAFRFLQALGGCAASVASTAMVRDFFPVKEGAKVFSLLMLILGVSPLFAPTVGGFVVTTLGWHWVFGLLASIVSVILAVCFFFLPEGQEPDHAVSLKLLPILKGYWAVLKEPQFFTYALAGAFAFSGLFVYVAGSPIIFMQGFAVSAKVYGAIFAFLSVGFIGSSQVNLLLLKRYENHQIFKGALIGQVVVGLAFLLGTILGWYGLKLNIAFFFATLACLGMSNPNGASLALAPFSRNVGSASALLGFIQIGMGALASAGVGLLSRGGNFEIVAILSATSLLAIATLALGRARMRLASV